jgi:predicted DNA-binding transcriptional regulator AlpA
MGFVLQPNRHYSSNLGVPIGFAIAWLGFVWVGSGVREWSDRLISKSHDWIRLPQGPKLGGASTGFLSLESDSALGNCIHLLLKLMDFLNR